MTSTLALTATSSSSTGTTMSTAESIKSEQVQKRMAELFQMLTAEWQKQLKMLDNPREALTSVRTVEMHEGVLFLNKACGDVVHWKISAQQIKKLRKAVRVYEKSNDTSLIKIQFAEVIKTALAVPPGISIEVSLTAQGTNEVTEHTFGKTDLELQENGLRLISGIDFTDFFKGQAVNIRGSNYRILQLFALTIKNKKLEIAVRGTPCATDSDHPEKVREETYICKLLQTAGIIAHYAAVGFIEADKIVGATPKFLLSTKKKLYGKLLSAEEEVEIMSLARHILLCKGVPETEILNLISTELQ